jgi:hypothetical protein
VSRVSCHAPLQFFSRSHNVTIFQAVLCCWIRECKKMESSLNSKYFYYLVTLLRMIIYLYECRCSIAYLRLYLHTSDGESLTLFDLVDELNFLNQASGTYNYV